MRGKTIYGIWARSKITIGAEEEEPAAAEPTESLDTGAPPTNSYLPASPFPIPATTFYTTYILPNRPYFPEKLISVSPPGDSSTPTTTYDPDPYTITLKSSSHKSLFAFLKSAEKTSLITTKSPPKKHSAQTDILIASVNATHPDVQAHASYVTVGEVEAKAARKALREEKAEGSARSKMEHAERLVNPNDQAYINVHVDTDPLLASCASSNSKGKGKSKDKANDKGKDKRKGRGKEEQKRRGCNWEFDAERALETSVALQSWTYARIRILQLNLFKQKVKELDAALGIEEPMPDNDDAAKIVSELDQMVKKCGDGLKELFTLFMKLSLTKETLDPFMWYHPYTFHPRENNTKLVSQDTSRPSFARKPPFALLTPATPSGTEDSWRVKPTPSQPPQSPQTPREPAEHPRAMFFVTPPPSALDQVQSKSFADFEVVNYSELAKFIGVPEKSEEKSVVSEKAETIIPEKPQRPVASDFFEEKPSLTDISPSTSTPSDAEIWRKPRKPSSVLYSETTNHRVMLLRQRMSHNSVIPEVVVCAFCFTDTHVAVCDENGNGATFIHTSPLGITTTEGLGATCQSRIDTLFLDNSKPNNAYRLETFRSAGSISVTTSPQLRSYFVNKRIFPDTPVTKDTEGSVSDKGFLEHASENTLAIYQKIMYSVGQRYVPVIEADGSDTRWAEPPFLETLSYSRQSTNSQLVVPPSTSLSPFLPLTTFVSLQPNVIRTQVDLESARLGHRSLVTRYHAPNSESDEDEFDFDYEEDVGRNVVPALFLAKAYS
ncbi:hypothetical protein BT96DRAFT_1008946 [Gymnopus androsaceus JB14]|uniref:Uncharacterized protein n=1 Tax=Gymnopus androsaceus JB14 TaxID=1447944 RepID=A0A6A4GDK3_9AGAR|nr:hypothetical protein BT96DRAFT_1008946 [Gymnopus androsaceus JB14]